LGDGSGYVVSKEALRRFGTRRSQDCSMDTGVEDRDMGQCLRHLGVKTADSRDSLGRSRFHCFTPETHVQGSFPDWYSSYNKVGVHGVTVVYIIRVESYFASCDIIIKKVSSLRSSHASVYGTDNSGTRMKIESNRIKPECRTEYNQHMSTTSTRKIITVLQYCLLLISA